MKQLDFGKEALPLYVQLKNIIKDDIENETYQYGDIIPAEIEFQNIYHISRITVRQAISSLEKDGYVKRARGKGTQVIYRKGIEEKLNAIRSFTDEMKERHLVPGTSYIHVERKIPPKEVKEAFDLLKTQDVIYVERIRTANELPIVCFETYFPPKLNLPEDKDAYTSIYQLFEQLGIKKPVKVKENIKAMNADKKLAELLDIQENDALLVRTRISYNDRNEVIEYTYSYYRGDQYSYYIELKE